MEDTISRRAVLDKFEPWLKVKDYNDGELNMLKAILYEIRFMPPATDKNVGDTISRKAMIDALHTWFRDGFDEDKWWNSTHVLAAIEGLPSVQQEHKCETCFECPLSHGCPKIKGCTNEQAIEYASQIPNDCPLSAQPKSGKWIYCEDSMADCVDGYRCNQCGFFVPWDYQHKSIDFIQDYNFCPHCGADMRGEQDEMQ